MFHEFLVKSMENDPASLGKILLSFSQENDCWSERLSYTWTYKIFKGIYPNTKIEVFHNEETCWSFCKTENGEIAFLLDYLKLLVCNEGKWYFRPVWSVT